MVLESDVGFLDEVLLSVPRPRSGSLRRQQSVEVSEEVASEFLDDGEDERWERIDKGRGSSVLKLNSLFDSLLPELEDQRRFLVLIALVEVNRSLDLRKKTAELQSKEEEKSEGQILLDSSTCRRDDFDSPWT